MRVPVQIAGTTHQSRSSALSNQLTQNWYLKVPDNPAARGNLVLMPWPGLALFGSAAGDNRGMLEHRNTLYKVTGATLYKVDTAGNHVSLGTIPGPDRCILEGIGSNVVVVSAGRAFQYDGSTVTEITDPDLESPRSCAHLNNQMIYDGASARFGVSDVGDATSINGLNYASAESEPDALVRVFTHSQFLYLLGERSIETWYNSGVGNPPFDRIEQGIMQIGLQALHSVAFNDDAWYFLADDNHVYRVAGLSRTRVTDDSTHLRISGYDVATDAIGMCMDLDGQRFYELTFPDADETLLYSENGGWTTLSSDGGRHFADSYAYFNRRHLVADRRSGQIYELDFNTYTDAGLPIVRIRDSAPIHSGLLNKPGVNMEMNGFEVVMETGAGVLSGQGSDPKIALQTSDDGGKTWGTERWVSFGKTGEFNERVFWRALGSFWQRQIRLTISDPVFASIHSAYAEVEIGI